MITVESLIADLNEIVDECDQGHWSSNPREVLEDIRERCNNLVREWDIQKAKERIDVTENHNS